MPDDAYSFSQARARLEDIVTQVRKKDVSLETSLDLLEEGVRLASQCTELIDSTDWEAAKGEAGVVVDADLDGSAADLDGAADATEPAASADAEPPSESGD